MIEQAFSLVVEIPVTHTIAPGFESQLWLLTPGMQQVVAGAIQFLLSTPCFWLPGFGLMQMQTSKGSQYQQMGVLSVSLPFTHILLKDKKFLILKKTCSSLLKNLRINKCTWELNHIVRFIKQHLGFRNFGSH